MHPVKEYETDINDKPRGNLNLPNIYRYKVNIVDRILMHVI